MDILTTLKEGSADDLIRKHGDPFVVDQDLTFVLLHHMLQALDYLAQERYIHRDVKPANILYSHSPGAGYVFVLTDFGLCYKSFDNDSVGAKSQVGTPFYTAPEIYRGVPQTPKADVWSLFVTLAYAADAHGFREKPGNIMWERLQAVREAASRGWLEDMANEDPAKRASAGFCLSKWFGGNGRTTDPGIDP